MATPYLFTDPVTGETVVTDGPGGPVLESYPATPQTQQIQPVTQPATAPSTNQTTTIGGIPAYVTPEGAAFPAVPTEEPEESSGGSSGYQGGYRSGGGSSGRSYGGGGQGGSSQDYAPRDPQYADGSFHSQYGPGAGDLAGLGDRISSGVRGAVGATGFPTGQQQVHVPGGASAGPFDTSAAASGTYGADRAFNASGNPYSGGGSNAHPLYQALAAKGNAMEGKIRGMAGGSGSSGGSSYGGSTSTSTAAPRVAEPRMRGLARGMDPTQAANIGLHPTFLLPKLFPGLSGASPLYQALSDLPAAQLGMLTDRNWDGGPSDTVNAIGSVYKKVGKDSWFPSADKMLGNLQHAGKGIEEMFGGVKAGRGDSESYTAPGYVYGQEPLNAAYAADQYGGLLDAALLPLPTETAAKYGSEGYGGYLIDKWGGKALKKPAGKGKPIYAAVGKKLMR